MGPSPPHPSPLTLHRYMFSHMPLGHPRSGWPTPTARHVFQQQTRTAFGSVLCIARLPFSFSFSFLFHAFRVGKKKDATRKGGGGEAAAQGNRGFSSSPASLAASIHTQVPKPHSQSLQSGGLAASSCEPTDQLTAYLPLSSACLPHVAKPWTKSGGDHRQQTVQCHPRKATGVVPAQDGICSPEPVVCWAQFDMPCRISCPLGWEHACHHLLNRQQPPRVCILNGLYTWFKICTSHREPGFDTTGCPACAIIGPPSFAMLYRAGDASSLGPSFHTIPVRRVPVFSLHVPPVELSVYPPLCLSQGPFVLHADDKEIAAYM